MPNEIVYVSKEDLPVWQQAETVAVLLGYPGISLYVLALLRREAEKNQVKLARLAELEKGMNALREEMGMGMLNEDDL